jgi:hypothetical protein
MSDRSPSEERVHYGLDSIEPDRRVEVPLRDLMFLHQVLGEFHSFFHQASNYPTVEHVERFLGNAERGAYRLLREAYYKRSTYMLPSDIRERFEAFDFPGTTTFDNIP